MYLIKKAANLCSNFVKVLISCTLYLVNAPLAQLVECFHGKEKVNGRSSTMASKSADVRPKITMACVECKERNYITRKNRRNDPDRLELKKFCPRCKSSQLHRETR